MIKHIAALLTVLCAAHLPSAARAAPLPALDELPDALRHQVRCTMLAGLIVSEYERGVREDARGLDGADVERLGEALSETLTISYAADAEATRGLLHDDFEAFSAQAIKALESDPDAAGNMLDQAASGCQPLWSGPTPLPPAPSYNARPVNGVLCFVLNSVFSQATRDPAGGDTAISMAFARRANRIEAALLAEAGEGEEERQRVQDELLAATDAFDTPAWDALPEQEAETIMTWCDRLAGPDQ